MLDTKGPEIRTGFFEAGGSIDLVAGQELVITTDYEVCERCTPGMDMPVLPN